MPSLSNSSSFGSQLLLETFPSQVSHWRLPIGKSSGGLSPGIESQLCLLPAEWPWSKLLIPSGPQVPPLWNGNERTDVQINELIWSKHSAEGVHNNIPSMTECLRAQVKWINYVVRQANQSQRGLGCRWIAPLNGEASCCRDSQRHWEWHQCIVVGEQTINRKPKGPQKDLGKAHCSWTHREPRREVWSWGWSLWKWNSNNLMALSLAGHPQIWAPRVKREEPREEN